MEVRSYTTIDKSGWGDGPWQAEPDKMQWKDEATGYPCLIVRGCTGALCGYVGVPETHPAHGLDYDGTPIDNFRERNRITRKRIPIISKLLAGGADLPAAMEKASEGVPERVANIDVHGGLTFSGACQDWGDPSAGICHVPDPGEPDNVWWFGFDCAHHMDISPAINELRGKCPMPSFETDDELKEIYREVPYVREEIENLAKQLAAIEQGAGGN